MLREAVRNPETPAGAAPRDAWWKSLTQVPRAVVAWAALHKLQAALVSAACLLSLSGLVVAGVLLASRRPAGELVTLEMALDALDRGAYTDAQQLAKKLQEQGTLEAEELGGPPFVLGAAAAYEADEAWHQQKYKAGQYLVASRYLQQADRRGFPPGRKSEGLYLLGKSLYRSGQIPASRPVLQEALLVNRAKQSDIHRLLAGAYLNDAYPKLDQAMAENALFLSDPRVPPPLRHEGLLQRAQILLRQGKVSECAATLDKIPPEAENHAAAIVVRGQVLIEEARSLASKPDERAQNQAQARQKYQAAIQTLRVAEGRDTLRSQATRKAMYLIGVCFLESEDRRAALAQFERTRTLYAESPEGVAANFQEAELLRQAGRDADALAGYRRTLATVTVPENFSNPWIPLEQLRLGMLKAFKDYQSAQKFEISLQLARLMYPLFPRARTLELTAEVYQSWGQALLAQADRLPQSKAEPLRRRGRMELRQAGRVYWRLAKLQAATRLYPELLWSSANAYMAGQDYRNAVPILQKYLQQQSRQRHAQALAYLGEALLATGQVDKALEAFGECIADHRREAAAHRARLLASKACAEKGDLQQAETLLRANLTSEYLTPASKEWRDSLFALGELLHAGRRYGEAIVRLEEALERYPDAPQTPAARYLAADCYRRSAKTAQDQRTQDPARYGRVVRLEAIEEMYQKALAQYQGLQAALSGGHDSGELTTLEKSLLRNSYFAVGSILFDLGQYEAAIKVYAAAANRYQNHPEVLEAYVQIAAAYRQLNKPVEARSTLEQAKVVLARMKTDASFNETTNYSRQQWNERLDALMNL